MGPPTQGQVSVLAGEAREGGCRQRQPRCWGPSVPPFPLSNRTRGRNDPERAGSKVKSIFNQRNILGFSSVLPGGLNTPSGGGLPGTTAQTLTLNGKLRQNSSVTCPRVHSKARTVAARRQTSRLQKSYGSSALSSIHEVTIAAAGPNTWQPPRGRC